MQGDGPPWRTSPRPKDPTGGVPAGVPCLSAASGGVGEILAAGDQQARSEAEAIQRRIEELRAQLYARPGVRYEDDPALHDELDRLIVRFVRLKWQRRDS